MMEGDFQLVYKNMELHPNMDTELMDWWWKTLCLFTSISNENNYKNICN